MHALGWGLGEETLRLKLRLKELFTQHKCLRTSNAYSTYYVYPFVCSAHPRNLGPIRTTKAAPLATENSASSWRIRIITLSLHYSSTAYPALPALAPHPPSATAPPKRKEREKKNKRAGRMYVSGASCVYCPPPSPSSPKAARAARKQDNDRARAASPPLPFNVFR